MFWRLFFKDLDVQLFDEIDLQNLLSHDQISIKHYDKSIKGKVIIQK